MFKNIAIALSLFISVPALVLGGVGTWNAFHVISGHVDDGTIQEADLKDVLKATLRLPDGQLLGTEIIFGEPGDNPDVLGLTTDDGLWRVLVKGDALAVYPDAGSVDSELIQDGTILAVDLADNSVTTQKILNGTILPEDTDFEFISSVDGVFNKGGNVDFVPGFGMTIAPNNGANNVTFGIDTGDLDPLYVNTAGDTMTGDLNINADLNVTGTTTLNNLVVTGSSEHFGPEVYHDIIDAQGTIVNTIGTLTLDDDTDVIGELYVDEDAFFNDDITVIDRIDAQGYIANTAGDLLLIDLDSINLLSPENNLTAGPGGNNLTAIAGDNTFVTFFGDNIFDANFGDHIFQSGNVIIQNDLTVQDDATIQDDLRVNDDARIDGDLRVDTLTDLRGNILLGNATSDLITATGRFNSHLIPSADITYDLGSALLRWRDIYVEEVNGCLTSPGGSTYCDDAHVVGDITIDGDSFHNGDETFYGMIDAQGTIENTVGTVTIDDDAQVTGALDVDGNLNADGDTTLNGNVLLGDDPADSISFLGRVNSDIIPMFNDTFNFGAPNFRFQDGFFSDSVRVGQPGLQIRVNNDEIRGVGQDLRLLANGVNVVNVDDDLTVGDFGGSPILSVNNSTANGPEAGPVATVYEVSVDGDLEVTGTIDPTAILLEPLNNGDTAIQVNNTGGNSVFEVNENGRITSNGNIDLVGGLITSDKANGEVVINGQLSVNDLIVSQVATFQGTIDSDLIADSGNTYDLGSSSVRWGDLYAVNGDFSGSLTVGSLLIGATDVASELTTLDSRLDTAESNILTLQGDVSALDGRVTALEALDNVTGGIEATCTIGASCVINTGVTIKSITFSPVGTGNLRVVVDANPIGGTSATVTVLGGGGATLSGVLWTAVY